MSDAARLACQMVALVMATIGASSVEGDGRVVAILMAVLFAFAVGMLDPYGIGGDDDSDDDDHAEEGV